MAALGRLSRSATKIVAKAANGFHLMRIDGYSQTKRLVPGQKLCSQEFTVGGQSWRIDYYPNGRDTGTSAISVYLQLTDEAKSLQQARYKFSLLDHAGNAAYELPAQTDTFTSVPNACAIARRTAQSGFHDYSGNNRRMDHFGNPVVVVEGPEPDVPGCGHEQFIGREELEKRREDLIRDDRLVIRCDVGVAQIGVSSLAQDELIGSLSEDDDDEEEQGYDAHGRGFGGRSRRRGRQRHRTDDNDYVKWCLTQEPAGGSRGRRHG